MHAEQTELRHNAPLTFFRERRAGLTEALNKSLRAWTCRTAHNEGRGLRDLRTTCVGDDLKRQRTRFDLYSLVDEDEQGNFPVLEGRPQLSERLPVAQGNSRLNVPTVQLLPTDSPDTLRGYGEEKDVHALNQLC